MVYREWRPNTLLHTAASSRTIADGGVWIAAAETAQAMNNITTEKSDFFMGGGLSDWFVEKIDNYKISHKLYAVLFQRLSLNVYRLTIKDGVREFAAV